VLLRYCRACGSFAATTPWTDVRSKLLRTRRTGLMAAIPVRTAQFRESGPGWGSLFPHKLMEAAVLRLCMIVTIAALLGSGAGLAQVTLPDMSTPNAGATQPSDSVANPSPIGGMSTQASIGGAGIPLGTVELFTGGLSPSPTDPTTPNPTCPGAGPNPGVGTLGTGSIFAGDGTMATSTSDIAPSVDPTDSGCGATPSAGAGPLGLTSTFGVASAFAGGNIPLGATALSTTGLGGTIGVPGGLPYSPFAVAPTPSVSTFGTLSPIPSTTSTLGTALATVRAPLELTTNGTGLPCGSIVVSSTPLTGC
jgi:hypothetical protein